MHLTIPVGIVLALLVVSPSFAEAPAVSQLNGKVSVEAGGTEAQGASSALGIAQGSITAPIGSRFGVQVDGLAATAYDSFVGGGTLHAFWRDPQIGLVGPIAALAGAHGGTIGWYGAEAELYAPSFTIGASGGYQDAGGWTLLASGGFYHGRLTVYPVPDLAITAGGGQFAGRAAASGRIEYQPGSIVSRKVSFFVDGTAKDNAAYHVTAGVRFYLGPDKTLIRRHREDDPSYNAMHGSAVSEIRRKYIKD